MRKELLFCLLFILLIGFVYAEETLAGEQSNNVRKSSPDFREYSNSLLSKQITIPDSFQNSTRIIFGLDESSIDLNRFIILFSIFIVLILIIQAILEIVPLFGEGFKSWLGAIIITLLVSITGAIKNAADWLFGFGGFISLMKEWGILKLILTILLLIILAFGAKKILHIMKQGGEEGKASINGLKMGVGAVLAEKMVRNK